MKFINAIEVIGDYILRKRMLISYPVCNLVYKYIIKFWNRFGTAYFTRGRF